MNRKSNVQQALAPIDAPALGKARKAVPADEVLAVIVATFEALADPTRARLLYALVAQPLCVRDLAILVGVSESAVSHQLRLLRDRHVVVARREGNAIYYSVAYQHLLSLFREAEHYADHVLHHLPDHPDPRIGRELTIAQPYAKGKARYSMSSRRSPSSRTRHR